MYTPSHNVENPEVEIVYPYTGESYVYIEGDDLSAMDPKLANGAVDLLPERFYRHPWAIKLPDNQIRIILPKIT